MKLQINGLTKEIYQGRNQEVLQRVKKEKGYKKNEWITFCQARMAGLRLVGAKGKGVRIFKGGKETAEKEKENKFFGFATVFNLDLTKKI